MSEQRPADNHRPRLGGGDGSLCGSNNPGPHTPPGHQPVAGVPGRDPPSDTQGSFIGPKGSDGQQIGLHQELSAALRPWMRSVYGVTRAKVRHQETLMPPFWGVKVTCERFLMSSVLRTLWVVCTPRTVHPAAWAAVTPAGASSKTRQSCGA